MSGTNRPSQGCGGSSVRFVAAPNGCVSELPAQLPIEGGMYQTNVIRKVAMRSPISCRMTLSSIRRARLEGIAYGMEIESCLIIQTTLQDHII